MAFKPFAKVINFYARSIGFSLMFIIPVAIFVSFGFYTFNIVELQQISSKHIVFILWTAFVINSGILAFNGILASMFFEDEVNKLLKEGTPINSAGGFRNLERKYKASNLYLIIILILALIAYILFTVSIWKADDLATILQLEDKSEQLANLLFYLSLSGMLFAVAAAIMIRIPIITGLSTGSLLEYYEPTRHPYVLKAFVSDTIYTLLDPITRTSFLKWSDKIEGNIVEDFAPKLEPKAVRKPLAVQNVLTLLYLHFRMPEIVDEEFLMKELKRIIPERTIEETIINGDLNISVWKKIFKHFYKGIPDIFLIIDRILLTLKETPEMIDWNDYWVISAIPPVQKKDDTQDVVFFVLNRKKGDPSPQKLTMRFIGADELSPHDFEFTFQLRGYDDFVTIPRDTSKLLTTDRRQLIRLVTGILYQGTGIWFSIHSENIGSNVGTIEIREGDNIIETQMLELRVIRGFKYILQSWGPKLLASLGVVLPIIRAIIGL
ncbi:MAG: hypothetical protein ACTSYD_12965 [Candidatus Heimdallarchaeaceae archaeon]